MAKHNELGMTGEAVAVDYLLNNGYEIVDRNWRSGHKEIDIIAAKNGILVIVEVKTRKNSQYGNPEDAVTGRKIRRIVTATDAYLRLKMIDMQVRFDVITILIKDNSVLSIEHIKDAFYAPIW
ncbi:MAG: YraN family protein [Bacteroidaceae bacterium]|nr:YraN family protein [Bacteroidaceae bacterium]